MTNSKKIEFTSGVVDVGWSEFTVRLENESWSCQASYLYAHPLYELLLSAVDLYDHIFTAPVPKKNAIWLSNAIDEPGGIAIQAIPKNENAEVSVFIYDAEDLPNSSEITKRPAVGKATVNYWEYANAVFQDAARAVARQGFTGFQNAWEHTWDLDSHFEVLPVEHFLYLASLVMTKEKKPGLSLKEEINLLSTILEKY